MNLIINTDGGCRTNSASNPGPASCAFVAFSEEGEYVASMNQTLVGTNNVAEFRGLLLAVKLLGYVLRHVTATVKQITFRADSDVMVKIMNDTWRCKDAALKELRREIRQQLDLYAELPITFVWVPREENKEADYLCNLALDGTLLTDLFAPLMVKLSKEMTRGVSAGQLFRAGRLTEARSMRVDSKGFALCGSCKERLVMCTCPALIEEVTCV